MVIVSDCGSLVEYLARQALGKTVMKSKRLEIDIEILREVVAAICNLSLSDENKYEINVALAGIAPDQITINTVNDFLILDVRQKPLSSNQDIIHKGIQNNTIKQLFRLEQNIQVDEAELTNGILKVKLHKKVLHKSLRRIIEIIEE